MNRWFFSPRENDCEGVEDLSNIPSGGQVKAWLLGVGLASLFIGYGVYGFYSGHVLIFGEHGGTMIAEGTLGKTASMIYFAIGGFIHFHWFWGLHLRLLRYSQIGKAIALLTLIASTTYFFYRFWLVE